MNDRIPHFAEELTPAIAGVAGEIIKRIVDQTYARKNHKFGAEVIWNSFQVEHRDHACRLMEELFRPLDDWGKESAIAAATLLQNAVAAALEHPGVWDRRLSLDTVKSRIRAAMYTHINKWSFDRGL